MGQISQHGWRTYYAIAFVLKMPLPTLILLALGLGRHVASGKWKVKVERWSVLSDDTLTLSPIVIEPRP
jgi:hypothetical protein